VFFGGRHREGVFTTFRGSFPKGVLLFETIILGGPQTLRGIILGNKYVACPGERICGLKTLGVCPHKFLGGLRAFSPEGIRLGTPVV